MHRLTSFTLLIIGVLLGALLSHLVALKMLPKPQVVPSDPYVFMRHAQHLLQRSEIIQPLLCAKLASDLDIEIDYPQLHLQLEQQLTPFNQGQQQARDLLIYLKGYAFGLVHGIDDKQATFDALACQQWLQPITKTQEII
ncbi:hypothetical protein [Shewanella sp. Isolate11]|uniref:hypothetical protein n=1 Tax=Shewanella sp. Isolate11 TaxID=2908530 RepID=UPI001EFCF384|nr:hypothetical protein [Shewanella sp. Isolate11]MCG9695678.1 hypothetical protein [Shewanella sp. Isolate11]